MSVARTWVEHGTYGRLLDGKLAPQGLEAAFPVTAAVALSFRLLGVGIVQAELPGVLATLGALGALLYLSRALYGRGMALTTLVIAAVLPAHPALSPLYMGRQVLAELPMLCYLLLGYVGMLWTLRRSAWFLPLAIVAWALTLMTKAQVYPFWAVSLLAACLVALLQRRRRELGLFAAALVGSRVLAFFLSMLLSWALRGRMLAGSPVIGLYDVTALVWAWSAREIALTNVLYFGLPTVAGLLYALVRLGKAHAVRDTELASLRFALMLLVGSWFAWFMVLSVGWTRYFLPPIFLGSIYVALLVRDAAACLGQVVLAARGGGREGGRRQLGRVLVAASTLALLCLTLPFTVATLRDAFQSSPDADAAQQVAAMLNADTPPDARIETYESELHFLLNRPYHYPPDQLHVALNRRTFLGDEAAVDYDPLQSDPDYLVVGAYGRMWRLYEPVLATGAFLKLRELGPYDIYQRVR